MRIFFNSIVRMLGIGAAMPHGAVSLPEKLLEGEIEVAEPLLEPETSSGKKYPPKAKSSFKQNRRKELKRNARKKARK